LLALLSCYVDSLFVVFCSSTSLFFFFSSRRRHTRFSRDWSSDVCSSDLFARAKCRRRPSFSGLEAQLCSPYISRTGHSMARQRSLGSGEATSDGPEARTLGSYFHCQRPRSLMRMPCSHTWLASSELSSGSCSRRRATASAMEA